MLGTVRRFFKLTHAGLKYGFNRQFIPRTLPTLRALTYINPYSWRQLPNRATALTNCLIDLGPTFVKFGQILSTRPDLLPPDLITSLNLLQDKVPPFAGEKAIRIIEHSLKQRINDVFLEFDDTPLASASVAQVHAAKMKNNDNVVVKVIRPNIKKIIRKDIKVMYLIASMVDKFYRHAKYIHAKELVSEFETTILNELDLTQEAASASQLKRNFANSDLLTVPRIYWNYVSKNVMVQERIYGVPISDIETLNHYKVNLKRLAEKGVSIFFTQVFRDRFFHADMHPGNVFVDISNPEDPTYCAIDFGIMGSLTPTDQRYLAENFLAFFQQDYYQIADLHLKSGWVEQGTRVDQLESAFRKLCEPFYGKPLGEISYGKFLMEVLKTARKFNMHVQPQLFLLQKTLLNVEGLGRQLYPNLDLWETAKPFLEKWMWKNFGLEMLERWIKKRWEDCPITKEEVISCLKNFLKEK